MSTEFFILYMLSAGSCIFKFLTNAQRSVIYSSFLIFLPHLCRYNIRIVGNSDHDRDIFSLPDLFLHSNIPVLSGWTSKGERACSERSARPLSGWCPKETLSSKRWWGYHSRKVHRGQREKEWKRKGVPAARGFERFPASHPRFLSSSSFGFEGVGFSRGSMGFRNNLVSPEKEADRGNGDEFY